MVPYVRNIGPRTIPMSIDYMDAMDLNDIAGHYLSRGIGKLLLDRERKAIHKYEKESQRRFDYQFIISDRDRNAFSGIQEKVKLLSNGVDSSYYQDLHTSVKEYDIIFCGNLSYPPNELAARFLIDRIHPRLQASIMIAGANASDELTGMAREGLTIEGYQRDLRDIYVSGKIMVIPIQHGSGQQNKALEAMSMGLPCVVTSFVNEAIGAKEGRDLFVADDEETFILHINELLSHPEKRTELGRNARTFVETNYSWKSNTLVLIDTIKQAIND